MVHFFITKNVAIQPTRQFFPRNVRSYCLVVLAVMLSACQSTIRFSSSVQGHSSPAARLSASSSVKSRANSSAPSKAATPLSTTQERLLQSAERWIGTPYRYGSTSRSGSDCSGFVMRVYEEAGIAVPRSTKEQFVTGVPIVRDDLAVGDLLFFNTNGLGVSHVGLYIGDDTVIHASSTSGVVRQTLSESHLAKSYIGARRILVLAMEQSSR